MPVSGRELLTSVSACHAISKLEADHRGTCSRAYYAVYQEGKEFHASLPSPGRVTPDSQGGMHSDLIDQLSNPTIVKTHSDYSRSMYVGGLMLSLYLKRIRSDYHRDKHVDRIAANGSIADAGAVLSKLSQPVPPPPSASDGCECPAPQRSSRPTLTVLK